MSETVEHTANLPARRRDQPDAGFEGAACPVPLRHDDQVVLGHGSGGKLTQNSIARAFYPPFDNPFLRQADDSAVMEWPGGGRLAFSTDSHIVYPLFFPGGDIGRLAVAGTVNDLLMVGAHPLWLTAGFILEEGLALSVLERVTASMRTTAEEAGIQIVAGDTKVVPRGQGDGLFINTSGIGLVPSGRHVSGAGAKAGDAVLVSGSLGNHGIAVLAARGELDFEAQVVSDVAPLTALVEAMQATGAELHVLRDPTRGGLATSLNEIAVQSQVGIEIDEDSLPVDPAVEAACEMLGFDPLYVANEGKLVAMVPEDQAEVVLDAMKAAPYGEAARYIGRVNSEPVGRVLMRTRLGTRRIVDVLSSELLPRIC
jgi:hydrogenase expression/formation protein HypE